MQAQLKSATKEKDAAVKKAKREADLAKKKAAASAKRAPKAKKEKKVGEKEALYRMNAPSRQMFMVSMEYLGRW